MALEGGATGRVAAELSGNPGCDPGRHPRRSGCYLQPDPALRRIRQTLQNHSSGTEVLPADESATPPKVLHATTKRAFRPAKSAETMAEEVREVREGDSDKLCTRETGDSVL